MNYRSCVVVLIGSETANRPWVKYEIEKAWREGKALVGIYIHNLKDPIYGTCNQGNNPFSQITVNGRNLGGIIKCHNPKTNDAYNDIRYNIEKWIDDAIMWCKCYSR